MRMCMCMHMPMSMLMFTLMLVSACMRVRRALGRAVRAAALHTCPAVTLRGLSTPCGVISR